ncbi:tRNA preQ1(34) S-adenosylmethionine ribosyltransferase-isomerase QueA [Fodinisporobacter ferrooxydans]|uniref:S-adenosylmethionine:tRNA ribosyltransferase-isomerase n=1 Tax=Fodinisporobacter ferrooxydans TaxID=2901836 RepID=A0ABY4CQF8_9BACL|nr:tRNA preQ1(34) S-adenosylmethionine ribosyltransferase-isomerase QueA [Alicyclobacillaceae bacterium MYW30-H2]
MIETELSVNDFDFDLPEHLIAQHPLVNRSDSRLMKVDRRTGGIEHRIFSDITGYLNTGDVLVLNNTRVIPARLHGTKEETGAHVELLLLHEREPDIWEVLVRPGKRLKPGARIQFGDGRLRAEILDITADGGRKVRFFYEGIFYEILEQLGTMPLPPYIRERLDDPERYQTVFARHPGSAAAPTAGLHFTEELLEQLQQKGVRIVYVTLHVGLGTFRPVQAAKITEHHMHSEYYHISQETVDVIQSAKKAGKRVIAVGTTATRTLETAAQSGELKAASGWTDIFIYPGYQFRVIDGLITNFHLPKSTLLMLVSAFTSREIMLRAYRVAVEQNYRFFSFGDAMFII